MKKLLLRTFEISFIVFAVVAVGLFCKAVNDEFREEPWIIDTLTE